MPLKKEEPLACVSSWLGNKSEPPPDIDIDTVTAAEMKNITTKVTMYDKNFFMFYPCFSSGKCTSSTLASFNNSNEKLSG